MDCEGEVITSNNSWGFSTRRNRQSSSKELLSPSTGRSGSSLADPVLLAASPCIRLGAHNVSGRLKKVFVQEISLLTSQEAHFLPWQWTVLCFLHLNLILAHSLSLDAATGSRVEEGGWRKSLGCILFPKSTSLTSLSFWNCSANFSWIYPLMDSRRGGDHLLAKAAGF